MDQARPMQKGPGLILCVPGFGPQHGTTCQFARSLLRGFYSHQIQTKWTKHLKTNKN